MKIYYARSVGLSGPQINDDVIKEGVSNSRIRDDVIYKFP